MNKHLYLCHPLVLSSPILMMHGHMNLILITIALNLCYLVCFQNAVTVVVLLRQYLYCWRLFCFSDSVVSTRDCYSWVMHLLATVTSNLKINGDKITPRFSGERPIENGSRTERRSVMCKVNLRQWTMPSVIIVAYGLIAVSCNSEVGRSVTRRVIQRCTSRTA